MYDRNRCKQGPQNLTFPLDRFTEYQFRLRTLNYTVWSGAVWRHNGGGRGKSCALRKVVVILVERARKMNNAEGIAFIHRSSQD